MTEKALLRCGFTTGSAAAAAACAAYLCRRTGAKCESVPLRLPDGSVLEVPVQEAAPSRAVVRKDGGDDPDVTTGAHIVVSLLPPDKPDPRGFEVPCGKGTLFLRGGQGVGIVTRRGLNVPPGHYAVNPGPRRMIAENLAFAGFGRTAERLVVHIEVPEGEALAEKTLNPVLGITGGISILGNSGIVFPYSNAAYAASVALQLRCIAAEGGSCAALATGGRTAAALAGDFPFLGEREIVRIGDFIYTAVNAARKAGLKHLIVGCMAGKLFKYACGERNTHAHKAAMMLPRLREIVPELSSDVELEHFSTMGELASAVSAELYRTILLRCRDRAMEYFSAWGGNDMKTEIALYHDSGERLL